MQRRPVGITGIFQAPTQKGPQSQKAICMQLCLRHSWNVYGAGGAGGAGGGGGGAGGTTSAPFFPPFERFIFGFAGLPANHPMEVACFGFGAFGFFPERTLELTTKRAPNNVEGATAGLLYLQTLKEQEVLGGADLDLLSSLQVPQLHLPRPPVVDHPPSRVQALATCAS